MKLWHGVFTALLLIALPAMGACAPQSDISSVEVIHNVKEWEKANKMFIPLESHWAAEYEGQGIWVVGMYCDRYEKNYPTGWFEKSNIEIAAEYSYFAYNRPYIWRYYERGGDVEGIPSTNELISICKKYPKLMEGLKIYE